MSDTRLGYQSISPPPLSLSPLHLFYTLSAIELGSRCFSHDFTLLSTSPVFFIVRDVFCSLFSGYAWLGRWVLLLLLFFFCLLLLGRFSAAMTCIV